MEGHGSRILGRGVGIGVIKYTKFDESIWTRVPGGERGAKIFHEERLYDPRIEEHGK